MKNKKSLKIPKGLSESVNRRTDNTLSSLYRRDLLLAHVKNEQQLQIRLNRNVNTQKGKTWVYNGYRSRT